ncbi:hypothetical protein AXF42_Ash020616 [Apostasia shenzhenica]|uniref:Uncharacterized protein n=1 Tax=Apostasia shenzhenica TaxID=1088818 RepID=A0A2H9ZY51_9ASPA|nr:hypothetical protein AXF42_Ash020616 [Apostasia shenzhenica]
MGFLSLLVVASMPVLQLLLVGSLGAFLASGRSSLLSGSVRRDLNKLGGIFIWTHAYSLMKRDAATYEKLKKEALPETLADENLSAGLMDTENEELGKKQEDSHELPVSTESAHIKLPEQSITEPLLHSEKLGTSDPLWKKVLSTVHQLVDELLAPPTSAAITGFFVGAIPWLKSLIVGSSAPLRVIQDSLELLG